MIKFYEVFLISGIFCSFLTSFILLFKSRRPKFANRLLGSVFFVIGLFLLLQVLLVTTRITEIPYLYRVGSPLYYLVPPLCFLYVRSVVYQESGFRKWDWLHFIPVVVYFTDLMPVYFSDAQTKINLAQAVATDIKMGYLVKAGFLPTAWHYVGRSIQGIVYILLQWNLVRQAFTKNQSSAFASPTPHPELRGWLFFLTLMGTLLYSGLAVVLLNGYRYAGINVNILSISQLPLLLISFSFLILSVYLFFKPELLYGLEGTPLAEREIDTGLSENTLFVSNPAPQPEQPATKPNGESVLVEEEPLVEKNLLDAEQVKVLAARLSMYLKETKAYQKPGISINELAVAAQIPARQLSYVLNSYYKQRFNDYINTYRIDYVIDRLQSNDWKQLSLEGLAAEAGFSSRSTFFVAFKKFTEVTPTEFIKRLEAVTER